MSLKTCTDHTPKQYPNILKVTTHDVQEKSYNLPQKKSVSPKFLHFLVLLGVELRHIAIFRRLLQYHFVFRWNEFSVCVERITEVIDVCS